ncbi:5-formyltetrahydrofolate cyclo-ligase [Dyadobacter sp. NIV53]|uniref:5-formyltetrahydrofolate cyclo-ligase n=1 Tax=Dyadobacter sp. NIV53 TaxID=2861765 RepID=UPI001C85A516|nr:5-formyltetrahydrofolate cyclo-ligase [Dyadobacter sp. NIV53]
MDKASLRREFLQKRLDLTQNEVEIKSLLIAEKTSDFLKNKSFQTIHTFLPQLNKNEIDTRKIISRLKLSFPHIVVVLPYIIPSTREMNHFIFTEETSLVENKWGIPEPDPALSKLIRPEEIDIVLIPLLAFDQSGYRAGYGGGYYDRFLAQCKTETLKVGLSFFEPVKSIEDIDKYDIRMDACILPSGVYEW